VPLPVARGHNGLPAVTGHLLGDHGRRRVRHGGDRTLDARLLAELLPR
jgi:hypothetical protein